MIKGLDPAAHIALGSALQALADRLILLIGSGFPFHNMRAFFTPNTEAFRDANRAFERWPVSTCSDKSITEDEWAERLVAWESVPSARYCHPREEHLLPLHVCYGFAGRACSKAYELQILNKESSMYLWEVDG